MNYAICLETLPFLPGHFFHVHLWQNPDSGVHTSRIRCTRPNQCGWGPLHHRVECTREGKKLHRYRRICTSREIRLSCSAFLGLASLLLPWPAFLSPVYLRSRSCAVEALQPSVDSFPYVLEKRNV
jgi:hypothetical protein